MWKVGGDWTYFLLFIVLETDFLLYVLSFAWISWYIFSTLVTTFRPIKSTLYSVFYPFINSSYKFRSAFCVCMWFSSQLSSINFQSCERPSFWWQNCVGILKICYSGNLFSLLLFRASVKASKSSVDVLHLSHCGDFSL